MSNHQTFQIDSVLWASLRDRVLLVAKQAGLFIKSQVAELEKRHIEVKDLNSLVSYVDIEAEKLIVSGLKPILSNAAFLTEEGTVTQDNKDNVWTWVIDPLDGTTNFIHQIPVFSVSIALKYQNEYILGVVYDVMQDVLFSAAVGQGAWANDQPIVVSEESKLENVVLATGFPYNSFEQMEQYLSLFRVLFQSTRGLRRLGSAALDLCYVAKGSYAGFYEYGLNEWDIAAGICIIKEAGGHVTDFFGQSRMVTNKSILASNRHIHPDLLSLVQEHFQPKAD